MNCIGNIMGLLASGEELAFARKRNARREIRNTVGHAAERNPIAEIATLQLIFYAWANLLLK